MFFFFKQKTAFELRVSDWSSGVCSPDLSSVALAATAILNGGTEAQKRALLPGIASGETIAALAFTEDNGRWDMGGVELTATPVEGEIGRASRRQRVCQYA